MFFSLAVMAERHSRSLPSAANPSGRPLDLYSTVSGVDKYCRDGVPIKVMPSIQVVVGVTCILSMIGAVLIILSYVLIKDIRTKAREILVNLSVMDFMAAAANFVGALIDYEHYLVDPAQHNVSDHSSHVVNNVCKAQAFFAMYGTVASVLWTICIAVYVFLRIMLEGKNIAQKSVYAFYIICYGLPLGLTVWFVLTGKLGYAPYGGSGWCSVIVYDRAMNEALTLNAVFANDIWVYLTIILVPLIFVSLKFYLRYEIKADGAIMTRSMAGTVQKVEMKLLFIPIFFILLRVWSLLLTIIEVEAGQKLNCPALLFFLHIGGIGDSGQGFANAILFVLFTPKVRRYFIRLFTCSWLCRASKSPASINNQGKSKVFYGAVESSDEQRTDFSENSPEPSRDSDMSPHSVLLNHNT